MIQRCQLLKKSKLLLELGELLELINSPPKMYTYFNVEHF
jgi:hypothetical protein